ncbi:MAG: hypothetical protein QM755_16735 [Luteolibacter sp.]
METEQLQSFNERLSQWISSQGFWFQLRYSMAGGSYSSATYHFLRLMFRIFLFLLVVGLGCGVYLVKRVDMKNFPKQLAESIGPKLDASESKIEGFQRVQGRFNLRKLTLSGGPNAWYSSITANNVRCDMGLLDGLVGVWKPGPLSISRLEVDVRAGAEDPAEAVRHSESFLKSYPGVDVVSLDVADANVRWGYSQYTSGRIDGSRLTAQRMGDGWRLQFQGGRFTQNWLRGVAIEKLVVFASDDGLKVEEGTFSVKLNNEAGGSGTITFKDVALTAGDRPAVSGVVHLQRVDLGAILPDQLDRFLEGSISGDLRLSGSTNSPEGIGFTGQVALDGGDVLTLRERIPLLSALNHVVAFTTYRKVSFTEGSFTLKSGAGLLDVRDVKLKAKGDIMNLVGRLRVRPPTDAEMESDLTRKSPKDLAPIFSRGSIDDDSESSRPDGPDEESPQNANQAKAGAPIDTGYFANGGQVQFESKTVNKGKEAMAKTLRYEGGFTISIMGDAFARAPELKAIYPPDPTTGRIFMEVPIEGSIFELTVKQAEDLVVKGRRE